MKDFFTKILGVLLSMIVVFSTLSFNIVAHFCADTPVSISFFSENSFCEEETDSCCNEQKEINFCDTLSNCEDDHISKAPCCTDENTIIEGTPFTYSLTENELFNTFLVSNNNYNLILSTYKSIDLYEFTTYQPPIIEQNLQVLFQSFLI